MFESCLYQILAGEGKFSSEELKTIKALINEYVSRNKFDLRDCVFESSIWYPFFKVLILRKNFIRMLQVLHSFCIPSKFLNNLHQGKSLMIHVINFICACPQAISDPIFREIFKFLLMEVDLTQKNFNSDGSIFYFVHRLRRIFDLISKDYEIMSLIYFNNKIDFSVLENGKPPKIIPMNYLPENENDYLFEYKNIPTN